MKVAKKFLLALTWLLLIYTSFELGMWQLHRAQDMNKVSAPEPDKPLIALDQVASAGKNIPIKAVNRIVSATGNYTKAYTALDQKIEGELIVNLDVRLLKLDTGHAILVVREITKNVVIQINTPIEITGRLLPRQNVDRAFANPNQLSRIDPSLVVSKENPFLYDGYIVLLKEKIGNVINSNLQPIASPQISQKLPIFYWQHISYVVVWWFMGFLLLIAPLFPQFRAPKQNIKVGKIK